MSARDTISLAHTARCKLMLAADKPDRNLRFILGHAFTLDKLRLRVLEIEDEELFSDSDSDDDPPIFDELAASRPGQNAPTPGRVSFPTNARPARPNNARNPSPPPGADAHHDDEDEEYADEQDDDEGGDDLSLTRFESASARPPRMIDDIEGDSDDDDDDDEPISPLQISVDLDLHSITTGPENEELAGLYGHVKDCTCHGQHQNAPNITKAWDVPMKHGQIGKRIAVVQVEA